MLFFRIKKNSLYEEHCVLCRGSDIVLVVKGIAYFLYQSLFLVPLEVAHSVKPG